MQAFHQNNNHQNLQFEYNPIFNYEKDIDGQKKEQKDVFKSYSINDIILKHNLGSILQEEFLKEFVDFREYNFFSYSDDLYLLGFRIFLESKFHHYKNNVEHLLEYLSNVLFSFLKIDSQNLFADKICDKFLGVPFNRQFLEDLKFLFENIQNFEDFMKTLEDPMKYKDRTKCEVFIKILCFDELTKTFQLKKGEIIEDLTSKISKIETFLLSDKNSFLDIEAKYILNVLCELCFMNLNLIIFDCDSHLKILESFPNWKKTLKLNENKKFEKTIIMFNDSLFGIYVLEKIFKNSISISENNNRPQNSQISTDNYVETSDLQSLRQKAQTNNLLRNSPNKSLNKENHIDSKFNNDINNHQKTLCVSCAGNQRLIDDYNKYCIYFLNKCENCQKTICSIHKEVPLKCHCFCRKCQGKTEKRYHFKRSSDFGYSDECYEIIECKKCKTMNCFYCNKSMENYEDFCDCQCQVCAKKILNKFESQEKPLYKCLDCSLICNGCMIRKGENGNSLYPCYVCKERYCRTCLNESIINNKKNDKVIVKNEKLKKKNGNNTNKIDAEKKNDNKKIKLICKYCQENKKPPNKEKNNKGFFDKYFN